MIGTHTPEYVSRTAFNRTVGFSPISSQGKKRMVRKPIMIVEKNEWNFLKEYIYLNDFSSSKDYFRLTKLTKLTKIWPEIISLAYIDKI